MLSIHQMMLPFSRYIEVMGVTMTAASSVFVLRKLVYAPLPISA